MQKKIESVTLLVENKPGVLNQLIGHIRQEGWNIKSLNVDETEDSAVSKMQIDIECSYSKLSSVMDRLMYLDCVIKAAIYKDGEILEKIKPKSKNLDELLVRTTVKPEIPPKKSDVYRILAINPGSTSTKIALYDNEQALFVESIKHDRNMLDSISGGILGQREYRAEAVYKKFEEYSVDIKELDAVIGRGGLLRPIESGVYIVNDIMLNDLNGEKAAVHASALGAIIASDISKKAGLPAFVVDPIVVDELERYAKLTGMPGIERESVFHALNQKAVARRCAAEIGKDYFSSRFVVAHLGGGITVGAHRYGRVIDVNNALTGEGPFTPERTGAVPAVPLIKMCFSGEYTEEEMLARINNHGGMQGYLGTNDHAAVERMIKYGDEFAELVNESMAYQVCKEIGAMIAVLEGRVDAVILTGGLARSSGFTGLIKQRINLMAPIYVYPGEDEMYSLISGGLRVLRGEEAPLEYI